MKARDDLVPRGGTSLQPTSGGMRAGIPGAAPVLEARTYAAALSYVGITRRTVGWVQTASGPTPLVFVGAVLFLLVMYAFLVAWYVLVFGIFGIFTVPFRLVRRSHRRQEHLAEAQLATMQALLEHQQAGTPPTHS